MTTPHRTSPKPHRLRRLLRWTFAALAALTALTFAIIYVTLLHDLPPVAQAETRLVRPTSKILDRNGRLLYEMVDPEAGKQVNLDLSAIPAACVEATLSTEDSRFYVHPGVDPIAIGRAFWQNVRAERGIASGASTLTQQLARSLLLPQDERYVQSYSRKIREAWLAFQLERRYSKDQLLALYLNQTYFGNFAFGLEAAGQNFFGKPAAQLSQGECALLVGLIQYPTGYNPLLDPDAAKGRQLTVLRLMQESGYLNADEAKLVAEEPLRYRSNLFEIQAPHFVIYVQDLLARRLGPDRLRDGGLTVTTTLDLALQEEAEASVRYRLDLLNCRIPGACEATVDPNRRVDNAAAVVLDAQSGQILAMVGSPDYFDATIQGNVNAALSLRQPGSAIKPFTYAAAMDPALSAQHGLDPLTPASIIADLPTTFQVKDEAGGNVPYVPMNYDMRYHGPVSVRTALANSYNIPAVKVLDRIGVESLRTLAAQAGISSFTGDYGLALTLGGGEVRLLELTAAFGVFARAGVPVEPVAILDLGLSILDSGIDGSSAPIQNRKSKILNPETAYLITDILADNTARIPAYGAESVLHLPFSAAAKTGTTTDWRDNWTVGYSTRRLVGVWVGNADNTPMLDISGVDGAGPIWNDLMRAAHPTPPPAFARPATIVDEMVCAPSGLLPTSECPRVKRELFIEGTQPSRLDDQFVPFAIDRETGQRAAPDTPPARIQNRVYWLLGPEYRDWMIGQGMPILNGEWQMANGETSAGDNAIRHSPSAIRLTGPIPNTAFRIHPGVPRENQRIPVGGYVTDGRTWAELRLVVDGVSLLSATDSVRLDGWWTLEPGQHTFWMEGRVAPGGEIVRSETALVVVE
ncbi:MAG: transglycosylase domain-containing protein [Caldilineaceae bacterium]|nr:transglycosylase domain-containing protein [Caldilineaceae bacterium]MBP8106604.1 transglycosylase domain-containing protein [Caldilineaceae bacterium]MBP8121311.1 transglycosylase domain-containing protein [Caldilineaceae bacterium]MBP9070877.1 transglycosylase domain-containing protein [Caldilineaceae bacterium]